MEQSSTFYTLKALRCSGLNSGKFICMNPFCKDPSQNPMICTQECQPCKNAHMKCKMYKIKSIVEQISQKRQKITSEIQRAMSTMENIYDEGIERIMQDKQHALAQIEFFGLNAFQAEFMKMITQGRSNEITGKNIVSKVHKSLKIKEEFQATQEIVNKQWKKQRKQFDFLLEKLKKMQTNKVVLFQSKITDQFEKIQSFFDNQIVDMRLLYRASENNFSAAQFHNKCDGKKHTITIILTQFGKVIGGYTPLAWQRINNYIFDTEMESFLFSITQNKKYNIVNPNEAIYGGDNFGPTFGGGHDIYIPNGRNIRNNRNGRANYLQEVQEQYDQQYYDEQGSYFNFPYSYAHANYANGQIQVINEFTGRTDGNTYANVNQYEVFQIQFI